MCVERRRRRKRGMRTVYSVRKGAKSLASFITSTPVSVRGGTGGLVLPSQTSQTSPSRKEPSLHDPEYSANQRAPISRKSGSLH